jgi:HSP20 family molecular chaperone IbpA
MAFVLHIQRGMNTTLPTRSERTMLAVMPDRRARRSPADALQSDGFGPIRCQPLSCTSEIAAEKLEEMMYTYEIRIPLTGTDFRNVYVFATSHSVLVELRVKDTIYHQTGAAILREEVDRRIAREFNFPEEIRQGSTTVQVVGDELQITCLKTQEPQEKPWSELVPFNTRASLGCAH